MSTARVAGPVPRVTVRLTPSRLPCALWTRCLRVRDTVDGYRASTRFIDVVEIGMLPCVVWNGVNVVWRRCLHCCRRGGACQRGPDAAVFAFGCHVTWVAQTCGGASLSKNLLQGRPHSCACEKLIAATCSWVSWGAGAWPHSVGCRRTTPVALTCTRLLSHLRYGWTPESYDVPTEPEFDWVHAFPRGRSITEVEMARACLNPPPSRSATIAESLFYVRDPTFLDDVPPGIKPIFCDGEVMRVAGVTVFQQDEAKKTSLQNLVQQVLPLR